MPYFDRVQDTTATTGTGALTLAGAPPAGMRTFAAVFATGVAGIEYSIGEASPGVGWEIGTGTMQAGGVLTRDVVLSSSNGNALVPFGTGVKTVSHVLSALALNDLTANKLLAAQAVVSGLAPATDKLALVVGGAVRVMTVANFLIDAGQTAAQLAAAAALTGSDIVSVMQGGIEVRTTLAAITTYVAANLNVPPNSVTSLVASSTTANSATLSWAAGSGGSATSWAVAQRTPSGSAAYTASAGTFAATGGTVTGLAAATYDFQVTATNAYGSSAPALLAGVTIAASGTAPTAITGLAAGTTTSATIPLTWGGGTGATTWTVQLKTPTGGGSYATPTFSVAPGSTGATINGLAASTSYDILVTASNGTAPNATATLVNVSTQAAAVTYTIAGYSGNAVRSTIDATATAAYGTVKPIAPPEQATGGVNAGYWTVSPTAPSVRCGWSTSNTTPPVDRVAGSSGSGSGSLNGMEPMTDQGGGVWRNNGYLVATVGTGDGDPVGPGPWYFWIKPSNGVAQLINASGTVISGA